MYFPLQYMYYASSADASTEQSLWTSGRALAWAMSNTSLSEVSWACSDWTLSVVHISFPLRVRKRENSRRGGNLWIRCIVR